MRKPKKFNPHPFDYHQEIELEILSLSNLGVGIARVQLEDQDGHGSQGNQNNQGDQDKAQQGWVVFVPHTLPGEKVLARIFRNDKSHSQADLVDVLVPSADRLEPQCSLFGRCGGCQYQHLSYDKQLAWKTRQVEELLEHMAGVHTDVSPAIPSPRQWGYRSKITPHFKRPRDGKIGDIGFLLAGQRSHLVDVPHCPIAMDEINDALPRIREETRNNAKAYKKDATLATARHRGARGNQSPQSHLRNRHHRRRRHHLPFSRRGLLPEQPVHPARVHQLRRRTSVLLRRPLPRRCLLWLRPLLPVPRAQVQTSSRSRG